MMECGIHRRKWNFRYMQRNRCKTQSNWVVTPLYKNVRDQWTAHINRQTKRNNPPKSISMGQREFLEQISESKLKEKKSQHKKEQKPFTPMTFPFWKIFNAMHCWIWTKFLEYLSSCHFQFLYQEFRSDYRSSYAFFFLCTEICFNLLIGFLWLSK